MRIKNKKEDISYTKTRLFFEKRVKKFKNDNPYSVTMYQDGNPELVKARNKRETQKLLPLLALDKASRVLDVACGIGRWSDAMGDEIGQYCGIDFCEGLIELAKERNAGRENRHFYVGRSEELDRVLSTNGEEGFNRILLVGALMYLNDVDVLRTMQAILSVSAENSMICIREPIGIRERLTLKDQFSEELADQYNAIYRTREELLSMFSETLGQAGYSLVEEAFLFEEAALNNRKETSQYYFIFQRKGRNC